MWVAIEKLNFIKKLSPNNVQNHLREDIAVINVL